MYSEEEATAAAAAFRDPEITTSTTIDVSPPPVAGDIIAFLAAEGRCTSDPSATSAAAIVASPETIDRYIATSVSAANNPFIANSYSRGDHRLPEANPDSPYSGANERIQNAIEANAGEPAASAKAAADLLQTTVAMTADEKTNTNAGGSPTAPLQKSGTLPFIPSSPPTLIKPLLAPYAPARNAFRHDEMPELEEESLEDTYYILLQTLFLVGLLIAAKICMRRYLPWKGEIELGEIGLVYTGLFYLLGVVFGGVNNDLKEAEKMPMDVVCSLDQLEDTFIICGTKVADKVNLMDAQMLLLRFARTWRDMLTGEGGGRVQYGDVLNSLADIVDLARSWDAAGAAACVNITTVVDKIRRIVGRGTIVQRTDVLPSARALLHFFILMSSILLFIASYKTELACGIVMACVITVTIFMGRMIKSMDDPFQVRPSGWGRWVFGHMAAVQTFPLMEYIVRMERRMEREFAIATIVADQRLKN